MSVSNSADQNVSTVRFLKIVHVGHIVALALNTANSAFTLVSCLVETVRARALVDSNILLYLERSPQALKTLD